MPRIGLVEPIAQIATAWRPTGSTLAMLRSLVRALRGGATRFVGAIKTFGGIFKDGVCTDKRTSDQIQIVSRQVYRFARLRMNDPTIIETCTERLAEQFWSSDHGHVGIHAI